MPNALDADWHVDVKKAWARPPLQVREKLEALIATLGAPSRRVFTIRGQKLYSAGEQVWQRVQQNNSIVYRLNSDSPVMSAFRDTLPSELQPAFDRAMQAASAALPMDAIYADLASNPESVRGEALDDEALREMLTLTVTSLREIGYDEETVRQTLRLSEPFRSSWDRSEDLFKTVWRSN
jgi:hypothetical protein